MINTDRHIEHKLSSLYNCKHVKWVLFRIVGVVKTHSEGMLF